MVFARVCRTFVFRVPCQKALLEEIDAEGFSGLCGMLHDVAVGLAFKRDICLHVLPKDAECIPMLEFEKKVALWHA